MLNFLRENIRVIRKLIVNQFGAAFLALLLAFTSVRISASVYLVTSILSVLFLLYLDYATLWEEGAKARIRVDDNRDVYKPHTGLWLGIAASAPNLLLGVLCTLFTLIHQITSVEWCGFAGGVCAVIGRLWQAMYMGILQSIAPGGKYIMLLIPIPAILLCWGAYRLGYGNFRLLGGAKQKK